MRLVLDANQFVSSILVARGNPAQILDAWRKGRFELLVSEFVLEEVGRVLRYPRIRRRHGRSDDALDGFVERLRHSARVIEVPTITPVVREDPDDDAYLALAVYGEADALVTGDHHLLNLREHHGVPILTAVEFLRRLQRLQGGA